MDSRTRLKVPPPNLIWRALVFTLDSFSCLALLLFISRVILTFLFFILNFPSKYSTKMSFDPNAGGFMPSGANDGTKSMQNSSPARRSDRQSMLPVTCRMLATAQLQPDDHYAYDGLVLSQVSFVGLVESVQETETNSVYRINDGTASVEARIWITQDDSGYIHGKRHEWREGAYVRVYGIVRSWQKQLSVVAYRIMLITDANEITFHFLETMHVFASMKGELSSGGVRMLGNAPSGFGGAGVAASSHSLYGAGAGGFSSSGNPLASLVFDTVKRFASMPAYEEHGPSRSDIAESLRAQLTAQQVDSALEFLLEDGQLFTTIDENHFKFV